MNISRNSVTKSRRRKTKRATLCVLAGFFYLGALGASLAGTVAVLAINGSVAAVFSIWAWKT